MVEETKRPLRRRRFGCILERKGSTGDVTSIEARYISPINGQRVSKRFAPGRRGDAEDWLETERSIVDLHRRGMMTWIPPRDRDGNTLTPKLTFGVFADGYVRRHRRKDGAEIAGSTLRNLRNDIKHLKEAFGDVKLAELTEELVTEWYYGPHPNGEWQFRSECIRLKMLLREACAPGSKGAPPLLAENPFTLPIPPEPEAGSSDIPPVTPDELYHIYNAMPGYTRLSVYLAACAGGMRIGEVCGLMDTDFDLENKVLMIRRSVSHGADDLGPSRIGRLKTKGSRRTVPIPDMLIPLIRMHLEDRPDQSNHMFFQAKRGEILCQNTLRNHFMKARKAAGRPDAQQHSLAYRRGIGAMFLLHALAPSVRRSHAGFPGSGSRIVFLVPFSDDNRVSRLGHVPVHARVLVAATVAAGRYRRSRWWCPWRRGRLPVRRVFRFPVQVSAG